MHDDAIREGHGVKASNNGHNSREEVLLRERENYVEVALGLSEAFLTPYQARYLAAKLYRLARRIRQRTEALDGKEQNASETQSPAAN